MRKVPGTSEVFRVGEDHHVQSVSVKRTLKHAPDLTAGNPKGDNQASPKTAWSKRNWIAWCQ